MLSSSGIVLYGAICSNWSSLELGLLQSAPIGGLCTIIPGDWGEGKTGGYFGVTIQVIKNTLFSLSIGVMYRKP